MHSHDVRNTGCYGGMGLQRNVNISADYQSRSVINLSVGRVWNHLMGRSDDKILSVSVRLNKSFPRFLCTLSVQQKNLVGQVTCKGRQIFGTANNPLFRAKFILLYCR